MEVFGREDMDEGSRAEEKAGKGRNEDSREKRERDVAVL